MPRKPKKTTPSTPPKNRKSARKSSELGRRNPVPKRAKTQVPIAMTSEDLETLSRIVKHAQMTQGALAVLALSELFKWFGAIYRQVTSSCTGHETSPPAGITSLFHDIMELRDILSAATGGEITVPKRRGRPRKVQTATSAKRSSDVPVEVQPKRRGRPRKVQTETSAEQSTETFGEVKTKRRGRPRKNPLPEFSAESVEEKGRSTKRKTKTNSAKSKKVKRATGRRRTHVVRQTKKATEVVSQANEQPGVSPQLVEIPSPVQAAEPPATEVSMITPESPAPANDHQK